MQHSDKGTSGAQPVVTCLVIVSQVEYCFMSFVRLRVVKSNLRRERLEERLIQSYATVNLIKHQSNDEPHHHICHLVLRIKVCLPGGSTLQYSKAARLTA